MKEYFTQLPGVTDAKIDLETNTAKVSYDAAKFKPDSQVGNALNRFDITLSKE